MNLLHPVLSDVLLSLFISQYEVRNGRRHNAASRLAAQPPERGRGELALHRLYEDLL